jgi:hypothetical protein
MTELKTLTVEQLRRAVSIKERIERLEAELRAIMVDGPSGPVKSEAASSTTGRRMSAAGRARIAAAARARWAKVRGQKAPHPEADAAPKRRKMSRAARAKMAAAARARWAKAKAAGRNAL